MVGSHYYKHPRYKADYLRLTEPIAWGWEREVAEKGPMFIRATLKLAEWKKRELEIEQKIETESAKNLNPLELKPGMAGFSIDLLKSHEWGSGRGARGEIAQKRAAPSNGTWAFPSVSASQSRANHALVSGLNHCESMSPWMAVPSGKPSLSLTS
jgi:hypothetical protein